MTALPPLYPPALKKGDTIGVIAPSSYHDIKQLQPAVDFLNAQGFDVVFHPQTSLKYGQFAGTEEQKLEALHDYFKDPSINAIFCTRGGNGAIHLLDKINYNLIKSNPKIFMGFSDITSLLNAISSRTGLITFHGPMFVSIENMITTEWSEIMVKTLAGEISQIDIPSSIETMGHLYGGNLSAFQTLVGTPYAPNLDESILMFEDINEHTSHYDRTIGHMKQAGWLNNLSGIILGEFINSLESKNPFGFTIEEIIQNHAPNIPLITNAPFGHGDKLSTLPIGAKCTLKNGKLSFKSLA